VAAFTMTLTQPKALVVDDNFYNRDLCQLALENVGYRVVSAEGGAIALQLLKEQSFDLLVLDLAMPELTGVDILREMRRQTLQQPTVIVVMTANPHMATEEVQQIVDFIVYKPIDIQDFAKLARRLVVNAGSH
jgi:CheY-like chemotaxis protein